MENISRVRTTTSIILIQLTLERQHLIPSKLLILLDNIYFLERLLKQKLYCIIDILSLNKRQEPFIQHNYIDRTNQYEQ